MTDTPISEQERREAEVVSRHLPSGYSAEPDILSDDRGNAAASAPDLLESGQESSLKLQGGDIHRDLYKINAKAKLHQRAATFSHPTPRRSSVDLPNGEVNATDQRAPGGFRRQFIQQQQSRFHRVTTPVTRNFVEFLDLYGSFAGEDLAESDDESAIESDDEESGLADIPGERRPLLGRRKSSRRAKKPGDATTTKSFFTLLKAFIGTGIMFLPKAFNNGGILFSSVTLVTVSLVSCLCFHLLLQCRKRYGGGYGDIGEAIGGPRLRSLILASVTISQIGFVCAGIVFTAENLLSFVLAVSNGSASLSTNALITIQLVVLIPLALIRNISKLGPAALLADVCILVGLTYIWYYDISAIAHRGIHNTVELFNPKHFTLTVGSAIFTFEGIGLLLPIQSSMKEPEKFSRLLYIVMFLITIIFTSVGALCYLTFGHKTQTEVISNFPQSSKLVNAVQFLYSLAVLVGTPVQLFPALRIMEGKLFGHLSGKRDSSTKWTKNGFRMGIVLLSGAIAALGASDLDKFVALIGSFACVPLVYIYPAWLHYKGIAESPIVAGGDIVLMLVGLCAMVYTTCITVSQWIGSRQ
jgi:proton-coupled amino acid transporter